MLSLALAFLLWSPGNARWTCREIDSCSRVVAEVLVYTPASVGFDGAATLAAECQDITSGVEQTGCRSRHCYVIDGPPGHAVRRVVGVRTPSPPDVFDWRYYVLIDGA